MIDFNDDTAQADISRHYNNHLSNPHGVPDNYVGYHPEVIDAVKRKYPKLIVTVDNDTFVRKRVQNVFGMLAPLIENNEKININPLILKMYLEYLKPSAEVSEDRNITFILGRASLGSVTEPEEKT